MEPDTIKAISEVIGYQFDQAEDLATCFVAPHRSDHDDPQAQTDGNRVWSNLGQTVIPLVGAHNSFLAPKGSIQGPEANARSRRAASNHAQWALSAINRAEKCKHLGLHHYIKRSPRQRHEAPSSKILGNVMSAIVGVIWNEQLRQQTTIGEAVGKISSILERIWLRDPIPEEAAGSLSATPEITNANGWTTEFHALGLLSPQSSIFHTPNGNNWPQGVFGDTSSIASHMELEGPDMSAGPEMYPIHGTIRQDPGTDGPFLHDIDATQELSSLPRPTGDGSSTQAVPPEVTVSFHNIELPPCETPSGATATSAVVAKKVVSPRKRSEKVKKHVVQHLISEEWGRHDSLTTQDKSHLRVFVESSTILGLAPTNEFAVWRLLWYAIGSNQTLVGLVKAINEVRVGGALPANSRDGVPPARYHLQMVVQMQQKTALNALLARCHLMKAFTEASRFFQNYLNATQTGFAQGSRATAGNPASKAERAVIDELVRMLDGELVADTTEHGKKRRFVKELSKVAKRLQVFTEVFGFGILALIPYTNMDPDMDIDDKLLSELDLEKLKKFVNHLQLQQGDYLRNLCALITPVLETLVCGQAKDHDVFPTNRLDIHAIVRSPKGSREVLDLFAVAMGAL